MKILVYSPSFYPNVGGLESIVANLAQEFVVAGHEVRLISTTPFHGDEPFEFEVFRSPNPRTFLKLTQWCDVFFQGCISLKGLWSLLLVARPLVVTHQTWYCRSTDRNDWRNRLKQSKSWQDHLKCFASRFATNISISQAIAKHLPVPSKIIPNSYRDDLFYELPDSDRSTELVYLGRLVSQKGTDLLLKALANLKYQDLTPKLTIIGDGPDAEKLKKLAIDLDIKEQVNFVGLKTGRDLTYLLNQHQIMVVPSLWNEPFGIVALEGIACGCVVVGSEGGGLKDAIGPCGTTFPNCDVDALTSTLANLLKNPHQLAQYRENAGEHLNKHKKDKVAAEYLCIFEEAMH